MQTIGRAAGSYVVRRAWDWLTTSLAPPDAFSLVYLGVCIAMALVVTVLFYAILHLVKPAYVRLMTLFTSWLLTAGLDFAIAGSTIVLLVVSTLLLLQQAPWAEEKFSGLLLFAGLGNATVP